MTHRKDASPSNLTLSHYGRFDATPDSHGTSLMDLRSIASGLLGSGDIVSCCEEAAFDAFRNLDFVDQYETSDPDRRRAVNSSLEFTVDKWHGDLGEWRHRQIDAYDEHSSARQDRMDVLRSHERDRVVSDQVEARARRRAEVEKCLRYWEDVAIGNNSGSLSKDECQTGGQTAHGEASYPSLMSQGGTKRSRKGDLDEAFNYWEDVASGHGD